MKTNNNNLVGNLYLPTGPMGSPLEFQMMMLNGNNTTIPNFNPYQENRLGKYVIINTKTINEILSILKEINFIGIDEIISYYETNKPKIKKEAMIVIIGENKIHLKITNCFNLLERFSIEMLIEDKCTIKETARKIISIILKDQIKEAGYKNNTMTLSDKEKLRKKIYNYISLKQIQLEDLEDLELIEERINIKTKEGYNFDFGISDLEYFKIASDLNLFLLDGSDYIENVILRGPNSIIQKLNEKEYLVITNHHEVKVSTYVEALEFIIKTNR